MNIKKNDLINLNINGMTSEGSGVGRTEDGIVIFVPNAAVGDELSVRIVKTHKKYAFGKIELIIAPSEDRIETDCPYSKQCGGCVYRHISYKSELEIKQNKVRDAITKIGGLENVKINPVIGAESPNNYRNKAQIPVGCSQDGNAILGFYAFHSHRIVDCQSCLLQPPIFTDVMNVVRKYIKETKESIYDETTHKGNLRHLYIRYGEVTGEIMVCLVINSEKIKNEALLVNLLSSEIRGLKSIVLNTNKEQTNVILGSKNHVIFGSETITDELCGLKFKISPLSFYQVNRRQAERLYNIAKKYASLSGEEILLDLYCGTGTIGLTMAHKAKKVIGVELVPQAIDDARKNAELNKINNAQFICGEAKKAAADMKKQGIKPDVVVIDPPRKGCDSELITTVMDMEPNLIVYVSCDPATLARDLKLFTQYKAEECTPVDMFPRTAHVECVVLMSRVYELSI